MLLNCWLVNESMVVPDIGRLRLPQVGRVAPYDGEVPFLVLDAHDQPVVSVLDYLRMCQACGFEPLSIEAYARAGPRGVSERKLVPYQATFAL
jgi:hypothetical protein